jgi:phenylalanyl-tRNA synthetase beta chain
VRILVSWLREFVGFPVPIDELARTLGHVGFEVASCEPAPAGVEGGQRPDAVLDIEIHANRPDCMGVLGIAREVATAFRLPLRLPWPAADPPPAPSPARIRTDDLSVTVENLDLCPRYAAVLADVTVGPSPRWLAARLEAAGVRPINVVVDVTNYVLVEMGHPMHAFDLARLSGPALVIRRARPGERVTTLDGVERTLAGDMLVIADADRAQAVAGVMGGRDSEVGAATRTIVLESAWFTPSSIRQTSRRLGLRTEASMRFERGADINAPVAALRRCLDLIEQLRAGRRRGPFIDCYPAVRPHARVWLRSQRLAALVGHPIEPEATEDILRRLGMEVEAAWSDPASAAWMVTVPSRRIDIQREVDLVEEVARHYGFDRVLSRFPPLLHPPGPSDPRLARDRRLRRLMAAAGWSEAMTFAFIEQRLARAFDDEDNLVPIANPLSESFAVLRPAVVASLLGSVAHNRRHGRRDVRLFELGARFDRRGGESRAVGFAITGSGEPEHWSAPARPVDFFDARAVVERLAEAFGVVVTFDPLAQPCLVPGRAALVRGRRADGNADEPLGFVGQLAPSAAALYGLPDGEEVYVGEIDADRLDRVARPTDALRVAPLPRYPSAVRDVSVLVDATLPAAELRGTIWAAAPPTLVRVREFDRYQGRGIADGAVSLSFRLTFRAVDRTLVDPEIERATGDIVAALERAHGARRR